jgi:uncharacterized protein (TIGR03437 family)
MASSQSALLSYFPVPAGAQTCCTATDNAGNLFLVYSTLDRDANNFDVSIMQLDSNFQITVTASVTVPFPPLIAAVDSNGNLWLAGWQTMVKLASSNTLASVVDLGGSDVNGITTATAIAIDPSGNVYVTGTTTQTDFPVTPGAFQSFPNISIPPISLGNGGYAFGFVSKYSSNGTRILSTLVRGVQTTCPPSSPYQSCAPATQPYAIAVDASGAVTIAGETNTTDYPATPNAPQPLCRCNTFSVFITRLNPDLSGLVWSTFLSGAGATITGIAAEPDGGVVVAGITSETDFPTTSGAIEPALPGGAPSYSSHGFVTRLNSSGTAWVFSTYLAGSNNDVVYGVRTDSAGDIWVAGNTTSPDFPAPAGTLQLGTDFLLELVPNGSRLQFSEHLPAGAAGGGLLMNADGTFTLVGPLNVSPPYLVLASSSAPSVSLLRVPAGPVQGISILGVADSAAAQTEGTVAPGEFLSLYGTGLGPAAGIGAKLDSTGRIASELGGVTVLFDGQKAPLLWVSANQINLLVPYEIANSERMAFQVITSAGSSQPLAFTVVPAQPDIFVVVNADGTVNGPDHRAGYGSILTMYAGGAGVLNQSLPDGSLAGNPAPSPAATVSIIIDSSCPELPLPILYSGASPGLAVNVLQVDFQFVPAPPPPFTACAVGPFIQLQVGNQYSTPYQIYY